MNQLEVIIYTLLLFAVLFGISVICSIWIAVLNILRNQGRDIGDNAFKIPSKILAICSITFMLGFGICSVVVSLPEMLR